MKKIFKKNHVIITVLALLIAVAGYINYSDNIKGKTKNTTNLVDGDVVSNDKDIENPGEAVFTATNVSELIVSAKLEREQIRATNKETLLEIINNTNLNDDSKGDDINKMVELTDASEKEIAAELLLEAKGFSDVIVSITDNHVDVVIEIEALSSTDLAQVEDVVTRKTGYSVEDITITSVAPKNATIEEPKNEVVETPEESSGEITE